MMQATQLEPRQVFEDCLKELAREKAQLRSLYAVDHPFNNRRRLLAGNAWKAHVLTPKGKPKKIPLAKDGLPDILKITETLGEPLVAAYTAELVSEAFRYYENVQRTVKRLTGRAVELARKLEIRKGGEWREVASTSSGTYSSQGWSAGKYAERAAEAVLDEARAAGVECRVVASEKGASTRYAGDPVYYSAQVLVQEQLDVEIVRRLPAITLREQVRLCWKRGVNPRVYNPFLPPGYEEKVGLDCFGNDLRPASSPAAV